MAGPRVLIVEDDPDLRDVLRRALAEDGFDPTSTATGAELLRCVESGPAPDLLIVDVGLPDADGRDVCQALRARGIHTPVLFLTARDAVSDRVAGFAAGGDDYLIKPFDLDELVARLRALLRRSRPEPVVRVGDLELDPVAHAASCRQHTVALTPTEFRLLAKLAAHAGNTVRRRELLAAAWPPGAIVHDNTLDVYVARLRRKLRSLPRAPTIATAHGIGYSLR
jgi:two-component system OmpR family response regulator